MNKCKIGIDVSAHQGLIDWKECAKHIDFAIIRCGVGKAYDKYAKTNINGCYNNNIPFGLYWASYALNERDAKQDADACLYYAKMAKPLFPVYYDYEGFSFEYAKKQGVNHTAGDIRKITAMFCKTLENEHFFAGVYANRNYVNKVYTPKYFDIFSLWYAYWAENIDRNARLWQYTSNGNIPGIKGRVDMNKCYYNFPRLIKKQHFNGW